MVRSSSAAVFDPVFRVMKVKGACHVLTPGSTATVAAEDQKAYPFGTVVISGDASSCMVSLSSGNKGQVGANARLCVEEVAVAKGEKPVRIIRLEAGKIDVSLEDAYEQRNLLRVDTHCSTITALKGGKFSVDVKTLEELLAAVVLCDSSELKVEGPQFAIARLVKDQVVSIACSQDRGYIQIKNEAGQYGIDLRDAEGNAKTFSMEPGSVVKIMQRRSEAEGLLIVTILRVDPDGTPADQDASFTYTETLVEAQKPPAPPSAVTTTTTVRPPETPGEWEPIWSSTTTTTTTTTTRPVPGVVVPPATPVPPPHERPTPTPVGRT